MTLSEVLRSRRSVRRFETRDVPHQVVERLLHLTLTTAPSSKNTRSTRFVVVSDTASLEHLSRMRDFGSALLATAPCAVLVCGDTSSSDLWLDNAAISATILQLAAIEAELASCWVHIAGRPQRRDEPDGPTAEQHLREIIPLPADWRPLCAIALGYPPEPPKPHSEKDDNDKIVWFKPL
jgi:nitroreductase